MFDKLEDLIRKYEELMLELNSPDVASDPNNLRRLMKEQADLQPIVETYTEYKKCKQSIDDSLEILNEETDEENELATRLKEVETEFNLKKACLNVKFIIYSNADLPDVSAVTIENVQSKAFCDAAGKVFYFDTKENADVEKLSDSIEWK